MLQSYEISTQNCSKRDEIIVNLFFLNAFFFSTIKGARSKAQTQSCHKVTDSANIIGLKPVLGQINW